jgi:hypothetical protein
MKKILIILAILTIGVFGQNNDKPIKLLTQQEIQNKVFEKTIEATRVKVVNTSSPIEKEDSDFSDGTESFATATDILSGVQDTVFFNFGNQFKTCAVIIKDTTDGSALVDSVKIETYNSTLATWTTKAVGLYDAGTGDIWYGDCIVPGNGVTKKYYLNTLYPSQVRITWYKSVLDADNPFYPKAGRIVPIAFEGSN